MKEAIWKGSVLCDSNSMASGAGKIVKRSVIAWGLGGHGEEPADRAQRVFRAVKLCCVAL